MTTTPPRYPLEPDEVTLILSGRWYIERDGQWLIGLPVWFDGTNLRCVVATAHGVEEITADLLDWHARPETPEEARRRQRYIELLATRR